MADSAIGASPRQHYIDNLRNLAVLALILFHTARLFDSESWHMKDAASYPAADVLVGFLYAWQMPLLFMLAGASAAYSLGKRPVGVFVTERFYRLFVPLGVGMVLTVLPQVYLERISPFVPNRASPIDFYGGFLAFVPRFFVPPSYPKGNLSWHHLWFLSYLFVYSVLLAPLLWSMMRAAWPARLGEWLARGWRPLLPVVPLALVELALRQRFPVTNGLVDDWANHANYVTVLLLGALLAASPSLGGGIARLRFASLLLATPLSLVWYAEHLWGHALIGAAAAPVANAMRGVVEWLWIATLIGYSRVLLDRPVPFLTGFTRYALPFYIVHQLVIVWLGRMTFGWSDMPLAKYLAIALGAFAISYALARLLDLTSVTRVLVGLKPPARRSMPRAEQTRIGGAGHLRA